jgi:deferrochelatase/peroxidase EfeB
VLAKDPFGASDDDCGSFLVFRKLQQDVDGFKQKEAELQSKLSPGQDPGIASAFVVGRFRDGTPVALRPAPQGLPTPENNFIYRGKPPAVSADPYELRCPVSSHLRKVNPRGDTSNLANERSRRIARRGITYGIQGADAEVGLLFQCCQSSLEDQFEFIQATWSNRTGRPSGSAGIDPVSGEPPGTNQSWPAKYLTGLKVKFDFGGFVTLKGGGYFFLPSLTFLKQI